MPIKTINVSFSIDMAVFMQILAHAPANIKFEALGVEPRQKALPKPRGGDRQGAAAVILTHLAQKPATPSELKQALLAANYSSATLHNQLFILKKNKMVRKLTDGTYTLTAKAKTNGKE